MATSTLRRRLHHCDVDGRRNELVGVRSSDYSIREPLLGNYNYDYSSYEEDAYRARCDNWDDNSVKKEEQLHWTCLFSNLVMQWANWLASVVAGSSYVLGRLFPVSGDDQIASPVCPSPLQEERLSVLKERLQVQFDGSRQDHQDALRQLWRLAYLDREIPPLKSELWKDMGWQGCDPSTDFRGGGFVSLENLIFFATKYPATFQMLLNKEEGHRAEWEYPFAIAGVNVSFMLIQMLDLQSSMPASKAGVRFLELLAHDDDAFDQLYCVAFRLMDANWLARRASYMEFNEVLKSTRTQLESELSLEDVTMVRDLPCYSLLSR